MQFNQTKAYVALQSLSQNPPDLTKELTPERISHFKAQGANCHLFFGTERVSDEILYHLWSLADEMKALEKMEAMQKGEVVNKIDHFPSEERPALHTAMRTLFSPDGQAPKAKEATQKALAELSKLKDFLPRLHEFTNLVQIGIGGSSLGPEAVYTALKNFSLPGKTVRFLSNIDPDAVFQTFKDLDLAKTVVVVVSKSGSTLETKVNEQAARHYFAKSGLEGKNHFISVTGEKSPMDDPSHYLASFYMWDFVGGRYSVTSMVGLVMLAFTIGFEATWEFLRGADVMDRHALEPKNLPLTSALLGIWNRNFLHYPSVAVIPYAEPLARFPAHLQQLDMESNGKGIDKNGSFVSFNTGPIIWGEPGTNGQHSFFQHLHQGTTVVPLEIIGFMKNQASFDLEIEGTTSRQKLLANLFAQSIALAQGHADSNPNKNFPGNRPSRILLAERLDPFTLGLILAYYEHKVAFQGFIWNINSFDQEGVQLGKKLATTFIDQFAGKKVDFPLGQAFKL